MEHYLEKEFYDLFQNDKSVFEFMQKRCLDAIWYLDVETQKNQWISSKIWLDLGYEPETIDNSFEEWQKQIFPEDLEKARNAMTLHLKDSNTPYNVILRCKHKNGSTVYIESQAVKIIEKDGKPIRVLGVNTNVTAAVNYKKQKEKANLLDKKNKDLEQKNQTLTEFSYLTSHDLQSPLNTIISYLSILEDEKNSMNDLTKFSVEAIEKSAYRMKTFINSLLRYIVIGEDRQKETFKIFDVIEEIQTSLTALIKETKAEIVIKGTNFEVNNFRQDFYRVLFNLLNNALKYVSKEETPQIKITLKEEGKNYLFTVADNGIGIEEKHFDIIFQAFKRLHSKDDYEGTGIGLAECKKIVDLHKGSIWLESEIDKGSTFYVSIPKTS